MAKLKYVLLDQVYPPNWLVLFIKWFKHRERRNNHKNCQIEIVNSFLDFKVEWICIRFLTKPMASHALTSPFCLTDPTPVETALRSRANHVHTSTCTNTQELFTLKGCLFCKREITASFSWCTALGTRFRSHSNRYTAVCIPSCLKKKQAINLLYLIDDQSISYLRSPFCIDYVVSCRRHGRQIPFSTWLLTLINVVPLETISTKHKLAEKKH